LALACLTATFGGCADFAKNVGDYLNLRNSFLSPNEVGRFDKDNPWGNAKPKSMPILEQLDVVDEPRDRWANASDPTPADIIPTTVETPLGPGDTVRITVYELVLQQAEYQREAIVSETGNVTLQNIGSVNIAGLTPRQAEEKIGQIGIEKGFLLPATPPGVNPPRPGPQVTVTVLDSRANRFSVLGSVNNPGPFIIQGTNYRLLEALGAARDVIPTASVDTIYVIRQGTQAMGAGGTPGGMGPANGQPTGGGNTGPGGGTTGGRNPLDAIDSIERSTTNPSPGAAPTPAPAVMPGRQSSGLAPANTPQFVRPLVAADVTGPTGLPNGGLSQADLDAALGVGPTRPAAAGPASAATAPAMVPAGGDMMDQALGGTTGGPGTTVNVDGKTVAVPARGAARQGPPSVDEVATAERIASQRVIKIPLDALRSGDPRYNIIIRPGDVIFVQGAETGYFYVMGHVQKPGVYTLTGQQITLRQAVAAAGNLDALAIPRRAELIRRLGSNQEVIVLVNLQKIFDGDQPDIFLKKNDTLNIGTDALATFLAVTRNAYRASYGFGFVYDRNFYIQPQKFTQ
jgi:protein involved in polysaccharide export with SLBB domain